MTLLILIFCFSSFLLASSIVLFSLLYQKRLGEKEMQLNMTIKNHELDLLKKVIETQESEREKIAKDIHDDIGPQLTVIKLRLTSLLKTKLQEEKIIQTINEIDTVISGVRSMSIELSPSNLINYGLTKAIVYFMDQINNSSDIKCKINYTDFDDSKIEKQKAINIFRLYNELVNNLIKHARPSIIEVNLRFQSNCFEISITHDGSGLTNEDFINLSNYPTGVGIISIKSRILLIKGKIDFIAGHNSKITLTVPI